MLGGMAQEYCSRGDLLELLLAENRAFSEERVAQVALSLLQTFQVLPSELPPPPPRGRACVCVRVRLCATCVLFSIFLRLRCPSAHKFW